MRKSFVLELSVEDIGDGCTLKQAIARLERLAEDYGKDKILSIGLDEDHDTFGSRTIVSVTLRG